MFLKFFFERFYMLILTGVIDPDFSFWTYFSKAHSVDDSQPVTLCQTVLMPSRQRKCLRTSLVWLFMLEC